MKVALAVTMMACFFTLTVVVLLENRIETLEKRFDALRDIQDGEAIHMRFLDSDNNKLREDIVSLRQDVDTLRYKEGR